MNDKTKYTTIAVSSLSAMLNKIAGMVVVSDEEDPEYYDQMSCIAAMLANNIKMLEQNKIPQIPYIDEDFEPCDGDCENCELNC